MAEYVIVGKEGCKINEILCVIKATPPENFSILMDKWSSLAIELNLDSARIKRIRTSLLYNPDFEVALLDVIEGWVGNAGEGKATLDVLVRALEGVGGKSYADALKSKFVPSTSPSEESRNDPDRAFNEFIRKNLPELLKKTILYVTVIAYLTSTGVLYSEDETNLKTFRNESEKTREFYRIILTRPNCYDHLLMAFEGQTGVLEILGRFQDTN